MQVRARYNDGAHKDKPWGGPWTEEVRGQVNQLALPAPTGLTALPVHDRVMLRWDDPEDDSVTGYTVLRGPDADSLEAVAADTGSPDPWYVDTGVSENTSYAYAVKALAAGRESAPSDVVEVSTLRAAIVTFVQSRDEEDLPISQEQREGDPPPPPYYLSSFASRDRVTLNWPAPCCGHGSIYNGSITGYRVLRGSSVDTLEVLVEDTRSTSPWYSDDTVDADTFYVYGVKSLNENGASAQAKLVSLTTPSVPRANTLVGNMGPRQSRAGIGTAASVGSGVGGQMFTTGGHAQGYNLEGVWVDIFRLPITPIDPKVSIYATNGVRPTSLVYELTGPLRDLTVPARGSFPETRYVGSHQRDGGQEYYAAPSGATLAANTSYMVIFRQGSATDQDYERTYYTMLNSTGEANSGAASGWSIGHSIYLEGSGTDLEGSGTDLYSNARQIAIIGTPAS